MSVRGPNNVGRAVQTDPTLLRYASAITEQKKCWELLAETFDRFKTLRNNTQQHPITCNRVCKRTQHACNIQQCWELLVNNVAFVCKQPYNERMEEWTYEWMKAWMNERENRKMKEGMNYDIMNELMSLPYLELWNEEVSYDVRYPHHWVPLICKTKLRTIYWFGNRKGFLWLSTVTLHLFKRLCPNAIIKYSYRSLSCKEWEENLQGLCT